VDPFACSQLKLYCIAGRGILERPELLSIRNSLCTRSVKQEYGIGEAVECVWGDEHEYYPGIVTQVRTRTQPRQPSGATSVKDQRPHGTPLPTAHRVVAVVCRRRWWGLLSSTT
jgi:hypothetical protein